MTPTPTLTLHPHQGKILQVLTDTLRVLTSGDCTEGQYELFELTGPRNSGPPPHHHPWSESYFVLDGEVEVLVGADTVLATPGYCVNLPGGTVHTYRIASETARFLVMTSTVAASAFFQELHQALAEDHCSMEEVVAIATRHQVALVGAPPVA